MTEEETTAATTKDGKTKAKLGEKVCKVQNQCIQIFF